MLSSHRPSQGDLDVLALLTADAPSSSHPAATTQPVPGGRKKSLPRRDSPLDALLLSAVLAGSGQVTRHHLGHGVGAYSTCDQSRPASPARVPSNKVVMRSLQAPRSVRLERDTHVAEREHDNDVEAGPALSKSPRSVAISIPARPERSDVARSLSGVVSVSPVDSTRPKRRMSVDPGPVSQLLQLASPAHVNYYHGRALPGASAALSPPPSSKSPARAQVRCMARTRVPTPHGDVFLHLYHNSQDSKEHLAIVFDPVQLSAETRKRAPRSRREIRSRSLDERWREGETDMERVVRGAYVGRLLPGSEGQASIPRTHDEISAEDEAEDEVDAEADILPLVRIHSECFTGETIGSMRCDCGEQLDEAMRRIALPQRVGLAHPDYLPTPASSRSPSPSNPTTPAAAGTAPVTGAPTPVPASSPTGPLVPGRGVVIYMRQEGRGIGLLEKIRAYNLQDLGHDTVTANLMLGHGADERTYSVAAEILRDLGLAGDESLGHGGVRLLTNNPEKVEGLAAEGIRIAERVGMVPREWQCSHSSPKRSARELDDEEQEYDDWRARRAGVGLIGASAARGPELEKYLRTKVERMGHMLDIPE